MGIRHNRVFILCNLSFGHGIAHWYQQVLSLLLPFIQTTMGFSDIQYGLVGTTQAISSAAVNIPGGFVVDRLKRYWGPILALCMIWAAATYALLGASPNYAFLIFSVILISLPGTVWHLPATAAISQLFPERKGFAISIDQVGAQAGNFLGPLVTGVLLGLLFWRDIAFIYVAPALVVALLFWISLRYLGNRGVDHAGKPLGAWLREALKMVRSPIVVGMVIVGLLRMGAVNVLTLWAPRYLLDPVESGGLGMSSSMVGLHFALLTGTGVASGPVLGLIADKFGRKVVLVPALVAATILPIALVNAGSGLALTLMVALLGLFTLSLQPIVLAAVLDIVGPGTEATAVGFLYGGGSMVAGISPFVAAFVINSFGLGSIFYYTAILTGLAATLMMLIPLRRHLPIPSPVP